MNAGVALTQKYLTEDGLEVHMATNHLGHFLLANLLAPLMSRSASHRSNNSNFQQQQQQQRVDPSDRLRRRTQQQQQTKSDSVVGSCSRVVVLSSIAHWAANIEVDNLNSEKKYEVRPAELSFPPNSKSH